MVHEHHHPRRRHPELDRLPIVAPAGQPLTGRLERVQRTVERVARKFPLRVRQLIAANSAPP